jgi:hypothetical protein
LGKVAVDGELDTQRRRGSEKSEQRERHAPVGTAGVNRPHMLCHTQSRAPSFHTVSHHQLGSAA